MSGVAIPARANASILLGDLPDFRKDPLDFWLTLAAAGPAVRIRFGPATRVVINEPEFAQHILQRNYDNYTKDQRLKRALEAGTGPVLATSDGEEWRWRRKLMQPMFKRPAVAGFAADIVAHADRLTAGWKPGDIVDIAAAMKTLTMNIIGQTMFSVDLSKSSGALQRAYGEFGQGLMRRATQVLAAPLWAPTAANKRFRDSITVLNGFMRAVLDARRQDHTPTPDLLNMFLTHQLEDDARRFSEEELLHEMSAIVFAGHETTATALTWVFCLIAQHADVRERLLGEIDAALGGRAPDAESVKAMPYLARVIDEALRLYPPLYVNSRQAKAGDVLGALPIPAGTRLLINILGIHRNPAHWPDPGRFNPDRFTPEAMAARHSFAHIPFLKGPRTCVGSTLATLELQLIVPTILQRCRLVLEAPVTPEAGVVLQPKGPVHMRIG
jgi:cytochrome P450